MPNKSTDDIKRLGRKAEGVKQSIRDLARRMNKMNSDTKKKQQDYMTGVKKRIGTAKKLLGM